MTRYESASKSPIEKVIELFDAKYAEDYPDDETVSSTTYSKPSEPWANLTWLDEVKSNKQAAWSGLVRLLAPEFCRWYGTKLPSVTWVT